MKTTYHNLKKPVIHPSSGTQTAPHNTTLGFMAHIRNLKLTFALALLATCSKDTGLSERLEKLAANNVGQSVDISIAVPFAWDEVAVFGAYYPKQAACNELMLSAWGCFWLSYPKPDDTSPSLIAFLNKGEVATTALLQRCKIEVALHGRVKTDRGTAKFFSSRNNMGCKQGGHLLTQE